MRDFKLISLMAALVFGAAPLCVVAASQRPIAELKPIAVFALGKTADWVAIGADAVWVASSDPFAVHRIDPRTNTKVASVELPGEACANLALGAGSLWVPLCTAKPSLAKIDLATNTVTSIFPVGPAADEGGITFGADSIWLMIDKQGTLARIDPASGAVLDRIHIPPGSFNPAFLAGAVWITHAEGSEITRVDAATRNVSATVTTGPHPRFLAVGDGAIWTLNQGDGSITRVDANSGKAATIALNTPGRGGDVTLHHGKVWTSMPKVPLSLIDAKSDRLECQWVGAGGDALGVGHDSLWLTDYHAGTIARLSLKDALARCSNTPPL
jgi:virginiamycin B lyase